MYVVPAPQVSVSHPCPILREAPVNHGGEWAATSAVSPTRHLDPATLTRVVSGSGRVEWRQ